MASSPPKEESRRQQIIVGSLVILAVAGVIALCWIGRYFPGFLGEWFGIVAGIVTTPFLMESSLLALGLLAVLILNYWRQKRDGDEFVYLERAEGPGTEDLPESARWAIYKERPLAPEAPEALILAEGALEIGDYTATLEALASMSDPERGSPPVLALRIKLARATGKDDLADRLEATLSAMEQA